MKKVIGKEITRILGIVEEIVVTVIDITMITVETLHVIVIIIVVVDLEDEEVIIMIGEEIPLGGLGNATKEEEMIEEIRGGMIVETEIISSGIEDPIMIGSIGTTTLQGNFFQYFSGFHLSVNIGDYKFLA